MPRRLPLVQGSLVYEKREWHCWVSPGLNLGAGDQWHAEVGGCPGPTPCLYAPKMAPSVCYGEHAVEVLFHSLMDVYHCLQEARQKRLSLEGRQAIPPNPVLKSQTDPQTTESHLVSMDFPGGADVHYCSLPSCRFHALAHLRAAPDKACPKERSGSTVESVSASLNSPFLCILSTKYLT